MQYAYGNQEYNNAATAANAEAKDESESACDDDLLNF